MKKTVKKQKKIEPARVRMDKKYRVKYVDEDIVLQRKENEESKCKHTVTKFEKEVIDKKKTVRQPITRHRSVTKFREVPVKRHRTVFKKVHKPQYVAESCGSDHGHHYGYAQEKAHSDGEDMEDDDDDHYADSHSDHFSCARLTYIDVVVKTEKSFVDYTQESYQSEEFYTDYTDFEYSYKEDGKKEVQADVEVDCYNFVNKEYKTIRQNPEIEEYESEIMSWDYETVSEEVDSCVTVTDCHTDWECKDHEVRETGKLEVWKPVYGDRMLSYDDYEVVKKEETFIWKVPQYNKVPVLTTKDKYENKLVKKETIHTHVLGHGHRHSHAGYDDDESDHQDEMMAQIDPSIQNELGF